MMKAYIDEDYTLHITYETKKEAAALKYIIDNIIEHPDGCFPGIEIKKDSHAIQAKEDTKELGARA